MDVPAHNNNYPPRPIPGWFKADANIPEEYREDSRWRHWFLYLEEPLGRCREVFYNKRLQSLHDSIIQHLQQHPSEDDSDDPVEQPKPHNNNKKRTETMSAKLDKEYPGLSEKLLQLADDTDLTFTQFKKLLKRFCVEHK